MKRETMRAFVNEFAKEPYDDRMLSHIGVYSNNIQYNTLDILCSRQIGKTTMLLELFKEHLFKDNAIIVCMNIQYATALMRQLTDTFTPTFLRTRIFSKHDFGKHFRGVKKENLPSLILLDEVSVAEAMDELKDIISFKQVKVLSLRT